jgi:hypothetical protein
VSAPLSARRTGDEGNFAFQVSSHLCKRLLLRTIRGSVTRVTVSDATQ